MTSDRLIVVRVSGDVSVDSAPRLRTVLKAAVDGGRPVVADMVEVTFIDRGRVRRARGSAPAGP
jgi:anti-anti-sigma regulatory factor